MTATDKFTGQIWISDNKHVLDITQAGIVDLGIIEQAQCGKDVSLDPFEYPDTDARYQEFFDMAGSAKRIHIQGSYIPNPATWDSLLAWKETFEAFVSGYTFDSGIDIWLGIYILDFYSSGHHLWLERLEPPLLEPWGNNIGINVGLDFYKNQSRPAQNSASNLPICVTMESLNITLNAGESPNATYDAVFVQRLAVGGLP